MKLAKVNMKDSYADLMTKILEPETFTYLQDGMMVNVAILESIIERSGTSSSGNVDNGQGTTSSAGMPKVTFASEGNDGMHDV